MCVLGRNIFNSSTPSLPPFCLLSLYNAYRLFHFRVAPRLTDCCIFLLSLYSLHVFLYAPFSITHFTPLAFFCPFTLKHIASNYSNFRSHVTGTYIKQPCIRRTRCTYSKWSRMDVILCCGVYMQQ